MAGQDVSASLGGMLSQIGGALGGMSGAGAGLMRPIMTSFRPQLDPNSVESLQRQAAFQGRIGDTEQARLYTGQALALEERNKAEAEKQRKLKEGQERSAAVAAYGRAVLSGDKSAIDLALENANAVFQRQGIVARPFLDAEETAVIRKERQAEQAADRQFMLGERNRQETNRNILDKLSTRLLRVTSVEEADAAIKDLPDSVAERAGQLRDAAVARLNEREERALREADLKAPLEKISLALLPPEGSIDDDMRAQLSKEITLMNQDIDKFNKGLANGEAIFPNQKKVKQQSRDAFLTRIQQASYAALNRQYTEDQANENILRRAATGIVQRTNYKTDVVEAAQDNPDAFFDLSYEQAIRRLRNRELREIYELAKQTVPPELVQYVKGDPTIVLEGLNMPELEGAVKRSELTAVSSAPASTDQPAPLTGVSGAGPAQSIMPYNVYDLNSLGVK